MTEPMTISIEAEVRPLSDEELEAKALADYEAGLARVAEEARTSKVVLEINGHVYQYESAGGTKRDAYLRQVARQLEGRRQTIEKRLEELRLSEVAGG